jgi:DnaJ-class molecular chaperone
VAGDPYLELGVKRDAGADEVQKAFRKLAKELHPDKNPGNKTTEERFKRVSAAFELLRDPEKRKKFDRGEIDADGQPVFRGHPGGGFQGARPGAGGGFGGGAGARFDGIDLDDILGGMFGDSRRGGGGAGFGGAGFGGARQPPQKGADVKIKLDVDLMDTIAGNTRRVVLADGRHLDVNVPKGTRDGQTLRLKGQGQASPNGGPHGDALVELHLKAHPLFRLDGNDLHMDLYVSLPDAVLGAKVQAATPDGPVMVTLAEGSNSGTTLRLKGRGALDAKTSARGDLFVHVVIALPEKVDDELKAFAQKWRDRAPYTPVTPAGKKRH